MHSIERYGIVALLFLVVTVVAVLMWDGGKDKKRKEGSPGAAPVQAAARAPDEPRPDPRDAERRLSLVAESQPGPLVRQPRGRRAGALGAQGEAHPEAQAPQAENLVPETATDRPLDAPVGERAAPTSGTASEQPARDPVVGQAPVKEPSKDPSKDPSKARDTATRSASTHAYVVRSGDTLSEIAQHELGSARRWQEIVAVNPGLDPAKLRAGKTIQVPGAQLASNASPAAAVAAAAGTDKGKTRAPAGKKTWTVGKGENLWKIAERSLGDGKRWKEIAALNPRANPDQLVLGQVLTLPGADAAPAKPAPKSAAKTAAKSVAKSGSDSERPTLVASNAGSRQGRVR